MAVAGGSRSARGQSPTVARPAGVIGDSVTYPAEARSIHLFNWDGHDGVERVDHYDVVRAASSRVHRVSPEHVRVEAPRRAMLKRNSDDNVRRCLQFGTAARPGLRASVVDGRLMLSTIAAPVAGPLAPGTRPIPLQVTANRRSHRARLPPDIVDGSNELP